MRAKRCGSRRWREASSRGISVGFEAFFLDTSKICNNWSLTFFRSLKGCKSIVKLILTFGKSHRSFTRQPVSPNVHSWHRRFKHHQNSTRKKAKMAGEGKKGENLGGPGGGGPAEEPRRLVSRRVVPRRVVGPRRVEVRRVQAQT